MAVTALFTFGGSALFLLVHGKDTIIPKGTTVTAFIQGFGECNLFALRVDIRNRQQTKHQHRKELQAFHCLFAILDAM